MKILVCMDGSGYADKAMRFAGDIAKGTGSEITLLHVKPIKLYMAPPAGSVEGFEGFIMELAPELEVAVEKELNYMQDAKKYLTDLGVNAKVLLEDGSPVERILKESEKGYDMIVVGSRGISGIERFLLGSVSHKVAQYAKVPVLIVKP